MLGTIQMLKPAPDNPEYYVSFYNMYNLLQISDSIVFSVFEEAKNHFKLTNDFLLEKINTENYAEQLPMLMFMTGIEPPENVVKMQSEDRGIDTSFFQQLLKSKINPLDWFRMTNEFTQLYAIFEQSLREFALQQGYAKNIKQSESVNVLFKWFGETCKTISFLNSFEPKTFGLISNNYETEAIWAYFTKIRNCISHSGGRVTKKVIDGFNEIKSKHRSVLTNIQNKDYLSYYFLLNKEDDYDLFSCQFSLNDIIKLDESQLNFFRMFCVYFVESLIDTNPHFKTCLTEGCPAPLHGAF